MANDLNLDERGAAFAHDETVAAPAAAQAAAAPSGAWQRVREAWEALDAWLARGERHVTARLRVPPGGG